MKRSNVWPSCWEEKKEILEELSFQSTFWGPRKYYHIFTILNITYFQYYFLGIVGCLHGRIGVFTLDWVTVVEFRVRQNIKTSSKGVYHWRWKKNNSWHSASSLGPQAPIPLQAWLWQLHFLLKRIPGPSANMCICVDVRGCRLPHTNSCRPNSDIIYQ